MSSMDNTFPDCEKLYRAVFPESYKEMFWKKSGKVSSAAFTDRAGLSVDRGNFRDDKIVIEDMRKFFQGCIISFTVGQCREADIVVKYKPTKRDRYHSEIHGSEDMPLLSKSQRKKLAEVAEMEYYEK